MKATPAQLDKDRVAFFWSFFGIQSLLLVAQVWALLQSAYTRQEAEDALWPFATLLSLVLMVGSFLVFRRHRFWGCFGFLLAPSSILLALQRPFLPHAIID
jgi:hypothetical protein